MKSNKRQRLRLIRAVRQLPAALLSGLLVLTAGCSSTATVNNAGISAAAQGASFQDTDKLFIVDCLLPAQVRKLGQSVNYLAPRRPIKSSAIDCEIRGGEYVAYDRANYATALKVWSGLAEQGDPEAQNYVAQIYERGLGTEPDYALAAQWYRKAADQGYTRAQMSLGYLYENGLGVEQDLVRAMNLYRAASGLPDELEFISSVEAAATEQQLQTLQEEVQRLKQEGTQLREQLNHTQLQLNDSVGDQRTLNTQIAQLQSRLAATEQSTDAAAQRNELQIQLQQLTAALTLKEQTIAQLQQDKQRFEQQLASNQSAQLVAAIGPNIELYNPLLSVTRGAPRVRLRSPARQQDIAGKVTAPAGLARLTINEERIDVAGDGGFKHMIDVNQAEIPVTIVALDNKERKALLEFTIDASLVAASAADPEPPAESQIKVSNVPFGRYHALIIGNNNYAHLPDLQTAATDAAHVEEVLRSKYGFQTTLLLDADRHAIISTLYELRDQLTDQDNILIYYAGHGDLDQAGDRGFWLPVDAEPNNPANWISNVAITDMLNTLPAKHVMVVADSCYSGTMTSTAVPRVDLALPGKLQEKWLRLMAKSRSRTVLTSGGLQPVLDSGGGENSVFARAFLDALENNQGVIQGYNLYRDVAETVQSEAARLGIDQSPKYAPIKHAGHETGQFFFVPKG